MMNIYQSIAAVIADVGAVGKTAKNAQQGFMYRGIDAVMNALNPAFARHKIFVVPTVLEFNREERQSARGGTLLYSVVKVEYKFYAEDGSFVPAVVMGEALDSGDKSLSKAMSIAYKYACFQTFCIPTEDMVDPDAECHEVKAKKPAKKAEEQPAAASEEVPTQEDAGKAIIDEAKVNVLTQKALEEKVDLAKLMKLYKVDSLASMNVKQWTHAMANMAKIRTLEVK